MASFAAASIGAVALDPARLSGSLLPGLATAVVFLGVGTAALWRNPKSPTSLAVCSLGWTGGIFLLTGFEIQDSSWFARLHDLAGFLIPAGILHFARVFPVDRFSKRPKWTLTIVYAPWLIAGLVAGVLPRTIPSPALFGSFAAFLNAGALLFLFATVTHDFLCDSSPLVRRRIGLAVVGSLSVMLLPTFVSVAATPLSLPVAPDIAGTTLFLAPLVLAYAATKNDLFEMDFVLRRIVAVFALLVTAVAASGAAIVAFQHASPVDQAILQAPLVTASLTVVALTMLAFLQSQFQKLVNHWFDSAEYDSEVMLTEFSDRLAGAHGVASVISETEALLGEIFAPRETLVFLEQQGGRFWLQSSDSEKRKELKFGEEMEARLQRGEVLSRYESANDDEGRTPRLWREFGVDLVLPLRGAPLFGVLALGAKRSGRAYTPRDIRFLKTACNQLALGLTKATLFDQMEEDAGISAALIRAQNEIAHSLNAPDILDRLCRITATALDLECSHTLMWETEQETFVGVSAYGDSPEQAEELKLVRIPRALLGDLTERLESEDAIVTRGARYRILAEMLHYRQSSVIIMPLRREGELIGLHLAGCRSRSPHFSSRHERIARGIGHAASMALANAYLMEELASASRVKSDFVASMSHELRTPLNHIIGYNDLMIDGAFGEISEEQKDTLQRVRRSSHNLLDLIEATLNLSRLDANHVGVDVRDVNIGFLVSELADRLEHSCKKPGVEVEWKVHRDVATLRTDPVKLQMILKNLVENAVKFTKRGRVVINVRVQGAGVEFAVSDSGAGIPKELQAAIFEPFRRVHDPNATPGVGLGLHIVRRLVDLMQGTISVASEVDLGSCFRVWLPFSPLSPDEKDGEGAQPRQPMISVPPTVH